MIDKWMDENWGTVGHTNKCSTVLDIDDNLQDIEDYHSELLDNFEDEEDDNEEDSTNSTNSACY